MKKILIYHENMSAGFAEIFQHKEPKGLHCILWISFLVVVTVFVFLFVGHVDDVVRSDGVVRPQINVSSINNITSGEIESLFYRPGDFVKCGQKLLAIKGDSLKAQKKAVLLQSVETKRNIVGLSGIIKSYEENLMEIATDNMTAKARYDAFVAEKNLLNAKVLRCEYLYDQEMKLPESSTTKNQIETLKFEYDVAVLELNEYCAAFISSVRQELDQLKIQQENLNQQLKTIDVGLENLVLVSPIDGYVQEISSLNSGDYIFTDQQVLNIVPKAEDSCRIELRIPAEKMGKLKVGQQVKLRFPAFPYSEYKGVNGTLQVIQPDSQYSESGALFFTAYADVDSMELRNKKGIAYQIKPGFEVNARIVLENQSLMYFLLKKLDFAV